MNTQPQDQEVLDLLTKLKEANGGYPASMLAARREMFMKQAANVALGLGAGSVLKDAAKGNSAGAGTTVASKILEITLIAALAFEAGTVAFLYRDEITATVLNFLEPTPIVTTQPDTPGTLPETVGDLETPWTTSTVSETATATPSETPGPVFAQEGTPSSTGSNNNGSSLNTVNATPDPNENQGNQYGLTPRPDRTKENPGNGSDGNEDNNGGNNNNGNNGNNNNGNSGNNGNP